MKYIAVIDTDDYKDFEFFEDADGKYLAMKDKNAKYDEFMALHFTECKQESDVLDKIRAKIEAYKSGADSAISEDEFKIEGLKEAYEDCLEIIDRYTIESEEKE